MPNIAVGKHIEESVVNPSAATNGNSTDYGNFSHELGGFSEFAWPHMLTVDLERVIDIACVRILLWDGRGQGSKQRDKRRYEYRLLVSSDHNEWRVLHDTAGDGTNGWQVFQFPTPSPMRFIRVHGLSNTANTTFHIVQIEAWDEDAPLLNDGHEMEWHDVPRAIALEHGDGMPLSQSIEKITGSLERLLERESVLNPEPLRQGLAELRRLSVDVNSVERRIGAIRNVVISPIATRLSSLSTSGTVALWIGIVSLIVSVVIAIAS